MKHRHLFHRLIRGTSLIEGMVATAVFLIGMTGVIQFSLVASSFTSDGVKKLRASSMASQARVGLDTLGHAQLTVTGNLFKLPCSTDADVIAYADGIPTARSAPCVIDLDFYERTTPTGYTPLAAPLSTEDAKLYRRVLVFFPQNNTFSGTKAPTTDYYVTIVVSYKRGLSRFYVKQSTMVLDPKTYDSGSPI